MNWNIYFQTCTALTWRKRLSNFSTILIPFIFLGKNTTLALITTSTRWLRSRRCIQRPAGKGRYARPHPCCRRNSGKLWFPRHLFPYGGHLRIPLSESRESQCFRSGHFHLHPPQFQSLSESVQRRGKPGFQRMASRRHHSHQYQPTAGGNRLQKSGSQRPAKPGSSAPYRYASRSGRSRLHQ